MRTKPTLPAYRIEVGAKVQKMSDVVTVTNVATVELDPTDAFYHHKRMFEISYDNGKSEFFFAHDLLVVLK